MQSTSTGERLAALVHVGLGLQARLYRIGIELSSPAHKPNFFRDPDLERVRRTLDRHFPKRDVAAKEKGWDKLNDNSKAKIHLAELGVGYETFKECLRFRESALSALRFGASSIVRDPIRKSRPPEEQFWPGAASRAFLDLVCIYTKLSCQIERLGSECRAYVAGYNVAYFAIHNSDDEDFARISNFIKLFEDGHTSSGRETTAILKSVTHELMENGGETIIDMISYLMEAIRVWYPLTTTTTVPVWQNMTYAACTISDPPAVPSDVVQCAPVCFREQARGWVIWCFLACPAAMASSRAKYSEFARHDILLRAVLHETVVEPIFRDIFIRVHEEFVELFSWFPSKNTNSEVKSAFEDFFVSVVKNPKKFVRDCSIECINRAALVHRERRVILAQLLLSATYQVQNNPAIMGPKGASIVALLAAARDELNWYLLHSGQPPPKIQSSTLGIGGFFGGTDNIRYVKEDWSDGPRVGLLLSCHSRLFDQVRSLWWIFERYLYETIRGPEALECQNRLLSEHFQLAKSIQPPPSDITELLYDAYLLELRFETTQRPATASTYSSSSSYGDYFLPRFFFYLKLLGDGYVGGDGEDEAGGFSDPLALREFASLSHAIFFSTVLNEIFEETLANQPRHCLGFVDALSSAQDSIHPYCTEEINWLGERAIAQVEHFLKRIQEHLMNCLEDLAIRRSELDGQTDPIRVAERLSRLREQRKIAKRNELPRAREESGLNRLDRRPGYESKPSARADVKELADAQKAVRGLVVSLGRKSNNTVLIWNRGYVLREHLRETLTLWLERRLRSKCTGGPTIPRPCIILEQCVQSFDVVKFACEHGGFDAAHFIRQAWIRETSGERGTVVDLVSQWLLKFLETSVNGPFSSVVYSMLTNGFVRVPELESGDANVGPPSPGASFRAEMWLDQIEVDALVAVLGYRGVASICRQLKGFVNERMVNIKRWLFEDEATLAALKRMAVNGDLGCIRFAKATRNCEEIVFAMRGIGGACKLYDMLHTALHRCSISPSLLKVLNFEPDLFADIEMAPVLWGALSHSLAASLCASNFWKGADFILRVDAHANNAHLVGLALSRVIAKTQDPKTVRSRELEFVASFSSVLFEMKRDQAGEYREWPLRGMTLFLEKFIQESACLTSADLDQFTPFPIRHAAVMDRFLLRVHGSDHGMGAEEFAKRVIENEKQNFEDEAAEAAGEEARKA